jgi:hypothetical protein
MNSRLWAGILSAVVAVTACATSAEAKSQPFNRRAETDCVDNKAFCRAEIDFPKAEHTVISFVTCWLSYTGEVNAQLNITRSGEESGLFTLMTPTGGSLVKVISQSVSIYAPPSAGVFIIFNSFGGQVQQRPSCVVSGYHD